MDIHLNPGAEQSGAEGAFSTLTSSSTLTDPKTTTTKKLLKFGRSYRTPDTRPNFFALPETYLRGANESLTVFDTPFYVFMYIYVAVLPLLAGVRPGSRQLSKNCVGNIQNFLKKLS